MRPRGLLRTRSRKRRTPPLLLRRPGGRFRAVGRLEADQLEVRADELPLAQRDRLHVEHGFRFLAILAVVLLVAALGVLLGFERRLGVELRRALALRAGDALLVALARQRGAFAVGQA